MKLYLFILTKVVSLCVLNETNLYKIYKSKGCKLIGSVDFTENLYFYLIFVDNTLIPTAHINLNYH